ncbi:vegetative cell wall protein gp1-like [Oryza brachyantha]|uniref:vegetative cell wall protein gp1-like n=1 Tax=Oryza brachyantha TaxID=4533 RepID=UPI001ADB7E2F|nr:vegetative cell wall protein gp1-like [Oryza brachyantha]
MPPPSSAPRFASPRLDPPWTPATPFPASDTSAPDPDPSPPASSDGISSGENAVAGRTGFGSPSPAADSSLPTPPPTPTRFLRRGGLAAAASPPPRLLILYSQLRTEMEEVHSKIPTASLQHPEKLPSKQEWHFV